MKRIVFALALFVSTGMCVTKLQAQTANHSSPKVFVNPLGGSNSDVANMVTAKLIGHLVKHGISVVESVDDADAVLNMSGLIENSNGGHIRLQAGVRLVNKEGGVIWADDVRSNFYAESASSSFAENVAKNLEKALDPKK
jgi:hypothetical protein